MPEILYGHTPFEKMFDLADVYGIGYDPIRAEKKRVRLGIIGAGGVAQSKHLPAIMRLRTLWEPVEVSAICIRREEQGKKIAEMYRCNWYSDYRAMIRDEQLDGVLVLSSDAVHYEHAMACLEANLHVMVEKPITRSLEQSLGLCQLAERKNLILMTVSNKRYSPPYRKAKMLVEDGPVFDPAFFHGKFNLGYNYVDLLEGGTIHLFDLLRYFMGDVKTVAAKAINKYKLNKTGYPIDHVNIVFELTSGAIASLYSISSALSLKPWERVEIYGEKCWLAVEDQYRLQLHDSEDGPAKTWTPVFPNTLMFDEEFGGFTGLIENFLNAIRGEEKPLVTGWDGHKAYELVAASRLSIKTGDEIQLPLDPQTADRECGK